MKDLLKKLFAILMLLCIGAPLCTAILIITTVTLWPIDLVLRALDWSGCRFAESFEEFILTCYCYGAMFICLSYEMMSNGNNIK